jgi:hypothetical protein
MDINLCPNASPCIGPPHEGQWYASFALRDGTNLGMWVDNFMGVDSLKSVSIGATPPPSAEPSLGAFVLLCGVVSDATCTGAAGGSTSLSPNKPPMKISVAPIGSKGHQVVTLTFEDSTTASVEVAPAQNENSGWASVRLVTAP